MIWTSPKPAASRRRADSADAAVHHVGGRNDVAAGFGLDQRLLHQDGDGFVVEDDAVAQQAVMAVAGIGIERDVAEHADLRNFLLDGADGAADQIVGIERFGAVVIAPVRLGIGKQREAGDRQLRRAFRRAHRFIDRQALDVGHRVDRRATLVPSTRNSGQIRSSVVSTFSRTMRRVQSARRLRRGRIGRSRFSAGFSVSTGVRRLRSSGRPNLIAIEVLLRAPFYPFRPEPPLLRHCRISAAFTVS